MLSVVIPTFNSQNMIMYTLSSLCSSKFPSDLFEVLVVDNGSTDNTLSIARTFPVRIYHCPTRGIGPPRNMGIKKAKGEIVCFTDSDCIVASDWLLKIKESFEKYPEVDGVGGPIIPIEKGANKIQKLAGEIFVDNECFPKKVEFQRLLYGANAAFKKRVLVAVGGFEEPGGSGLELSWRLIARKKLLIFNPDVKIFTLFLPSLKTLLEQHFRWGIDNAKLLRQKKFSFRGYFYEWYLCLKCLPSLFWDYSRGSLRISQLVAFQLGRIYGYHVKSNVVLNRFTN